MTSAKAEHAAGSLVVDVTDATFDGVVTSERPVVVDFWAPWCGPCRAIAPVLSEIAAERADAVTVAKVNVDEQPGLAGRFGVQAIPQLLFFKDGVLADTLVGAVPKSEILKRLDRLSS
jgi:thioredoxin 1